jgi:hypothetical protein
MKSGMAVKTDRVKRIARALEVLPGKQVLVGVPEERSARPEENDDVSNATLGYIHEFGAPEANIPARPFLIPGIRDGRGKFSRYLKQAAAGALDSEAKTLENALGAAGQVAASSVQRKITTGPFAPLAASTLARRRARGRTGTRPLIDTGALRRAITWVVRTVRAGSA